MRRREFLELSAKAAALAAVAGALPSRLAGALSAPQPPTGAQLTLLHTNDVHSRIEPFPANAGRNAGKGGVARRAVLIEKIRREQPNVLLFDAGDFFQGTPYFNIYQGKIEIELMNQLGYDAATLGNHDFDAGLEVLAQRIREARFPIVVSNYGFKGTPVDGLTRDYVVFKKGPLKVGVYGLGINPTYWVANTVAQQIEYRNPVTEALRVERELTAKGCHYIVCLSHLGLTSRYPSEPGDDGFAPQTRATDLVIGGHTHTFLNEPKSYTNAGGKTVLVNQVGWAGINLGRIDVGFTKGSKQTQSVNLEVA